MRPFFSATNWLGVAILCAGCQNQPAQIANPFHSADRVPPPATRALAPGSGQPYYPGDPLPVLPAGSSMQPLGQTGAVPAVPAEPLDWSTPASSASLANVPPPSADVSTWGELPLNPPVREVLPVNWSDAPPESTPPRVRLPPTAANSNYGGDHPPLMPTGDPSAGSSDGFRPRGSRPAPF